MRSIWAPGAIVAAYSMSSAVSGVQPHAHPLLMQLLRLDCSTAICVNLSRRERFPNVSWLNCARILGSMQPASTVAGVTALAVYACYQRSWAPASLAMVEEK